jgi:ATP-binding cassette, subfamily F, member 3
MLTAHHLTKSYGIHTVLQDISFSVSTRERIGLIGPNGCGKTTIMRILAGIEQPDQGTVAFTRPGLRIGYLAQGLELVPGQTIQSTLRQAQGDALDLSTVSMETLEAEIASLAAALSQNPGDSALQTRYDSTLNQLTTFNLHPETILSPLGLADFPLKTPVNHLSGGQKTRLMLARVLLNDPHLLLLDEPTNHLDIAMLEWLENWLSGFRGAALIVSHDRAFLDNTVSSILELDPATQGVKCYTGNYTDYIEQKLAEQKHQMQTYVDQQTEIARMKQDIVRTKQQSLRVELSTTPRQPGVRRIAKKVAKKALSREKKLERFLESNELVEKPRPSWQLKLDFGAPAHQSKDVLITENLSVGYPGHEPLLTGLNINVRAGQRIAVTGPNGAGKTTLVRTICGKLEPVSGSLKLGANVRLGYMSQEQEMLDAALSPLQTIQKVSPFNETEARHFLHFFLFGGDDPLRPSGEMSYGERARLQLAALVAQGCTFLLLDEPINHLDIPARSRFEQALAKFEGTVLAVVHDRYFIERFASDVWTVENGGVQKW